MECDVLFFRYLCVGIVPRVRVLHSSAYDYSDQGSSSVRARSVVLWYLDALRPNPFCLFLCVFIPGMIVLRFAFPLDKHYIIYMLHDIVEVTKQVHHVGMGDV